MLALQGAERFDISSGVGLILCNGRCVYTLRNCGAVTQNNEHSVRVTLHNVSKNGITSSIAILASL